MIVAGVNIAELPAQYASQAGNAGRTLLLDGDFLAYQAAATVKNLDTAIRRFYKYALEWQFATGCKDVEVYLTDKDCMKCLRYLYPTVQPYQGNRKGRPKPPLLHPLRNALAKLSSDPQYSLPDGISFIHISYDREADDTMIERAEELQDNCIICSGDKDLRLTRWPYWNADIGQVDEIDNQFGYVDWDDEHSFPIIGHGTKFFWAQMLAGDTADNVKGIVKLGGKLCGSTRAFEFVQDFTDETACAEAVCWAYAKINQDVLAEAECLWLRRDEYDSGYKYLMEVVKNDALRKWIESLHTYHMELISNAQDHEDSPDESDPDC